LHHHRPVAASASPAVDRDHFSAAFPLLSFTTYLSAALLLHVIFVCSPKRLISSPGRCQMWGILHSAVLMSSVAVVVAHHRFLKTSNRTTVLGVFVVVVVRASATVSILSSFSPDRRPALAISFVCVVRLRASMITIRSMIILASCLVDWHGCCCHELPGIVLRLRLVLFLSTSPSTLQSSDDLQWVRWPGVTLQFCLCSVIDAISPFKAVLAAVFVLWFVDTAKLSWIVRTSIPVSLLLLPSSNRLGIEVVLTEL
jgi:hypothetical protein